MLCPACFVCISFVVVYWVPSFVVRVPLCCMFACCCGLFWAIFLAKTLPISWSCCVGFVVLWIFGSKWVGSVDNSIRVGCSGCDIVCLVFEWFGRLFWAMFCRKLCRIRVGSVLGLLRCGLSRSSGLFSVRMLSTLGVLGATLSVVVFKSFGHLAILPNNLGLLDSAGLRAGRLLSGLSITCQSTYCRSRRLPFG